MVIIGVKIPDEKLFKQPASGKVECVECGKKISRDYAYCPFCGESVDDQEKESIIPDYDPEDDANQIFEDIHENFSGVRVKGGVVAGYNQGDDSFYPLDPNHYDKYKDLLKDFLEPKGLWDGDLWGIWDIVPNY